MTNPQLDQRGAEINEHLDSWLALALERPQMYASSPEALEDMIMLLEQFKCILAGRASYAWTESGYCAFLQSKGYESATYCARHRPRQLSDEDQSLFLDLADFVKEYLRSRVG